MPFLKDSVVTNILSSSPTLAGRRRKKAGPSTLLAALVVARDDRMGHSHVPSLKGLGCSNYSYPALKGWAMLCRPAERDWYVELYATWLETSLFPLRETADPSTPVRAKTARTSAQDDKSEATRRCPHRRVVRTTAGCAVPEGTRVSSKRSIRSASALG